MYNFLISEKKEICFSLKLLLVILIISAFGSSLVAEEIILKNGKTIKGKIERKTKYTLTVVDEKGKKQYIKRALVKEIIEDVVEPEKPAATDESPVDFLKMRLSFLPGATIPIGDLADTLNIGANFSFLYDVRIPLKNEAINLRPGLKTGFLFSSSKNVSGNSLTMIPILTQFEFSYNINLTSFNLRPYISIAAGGSAAMGKTEEESVSSFDLTAGSNIGLGLTIKNLTKLEFILDIGYLTAFETMTGQFLSINIGLTYNFWGTWKKKRSGGTI